MASVIQKLKGRRNLSREFQITFSVNTLILECLKDDWQPEKLVIVWNKDDRNCRTKPIPWQSECDNPARGVHVWPEPDPVTLKTTLYKHHQIEGIYLDRCLKIQIKNETNRGQRKVIATGSLALDHYVTEEEHSFEVVVKLFPSNKHVLSGSIKFQLTSVMLVNGVPYCFNVKEEMRKYVKGAVKSSSSVKKGTKGREDGLKCGFPGSSKMDSNAEQSRPQRNSLQTAEAISPNATKNLDCASRNNEGPKKPRRKPPLPPLPPRNQPPVAPVQDSNCDSIEMKDLTVQSCKDQHTKDNDNCPPCSSISSKGKMKPKTKYPEELNPFAGSMYEEGQDLANFDETSLTEKAGLDDKQNPLPQKHKRKTRRGGKKNKKKYHKGWNPLGGGSFEELLNLHSEESADENTSLEDAPQTVKKTKPSLPNNKLKHKTDYPKSLKQFCASSDKEEDDTSSKSGKVLPSKTMYLENASGVTKENSKVQRDSWSEFSSPEPQGKKEQELNVEKASQPESMEISESEETWKVEDNTRDETVELKEANKKALAHNSFQTKFEEACHSVGVREVGATDEGASAVDERPVRSECFSREGQEVMTEPEEEEEEEEEEEALKDDSGKMTAWICEEGESVVSAGKGLTGVYPESQDIAGEQHPVGNESVQRTGEGAMHYNAVGTKAVAGTTSLKDVNKPCEAEDKVDTHCQKSKFAGPFHDDVVLSDGDKPKPCEAEDKVDTDYQVSEVAGRFQDDMELSDGDKPCEAEDKVGADCQESEVAGPFHDDVELSDGDNPYEADNKIDTDCQGSEVAGRFHDDIELSDGDNPFEANDKVDSDCQMPEDAGYFLDDMEEKVEADVQKREDSTTVDGDLLGDDGKPIPLALYANGFQGVEEFPECCQANAENDYVACPDPLELLGSRNDLSPDFVDNSSLVISQVAGQSEPDIKCDLASGDKPKQKCHSIYHKVMSPLQKKVASLKGKLPQKPPRLSLLRKKAAFASSELLKSRLEISAYVAEEMFTLDQEIDSLSNVIFKVENELQEAMKFAELHEESSGLKQDWLSLNNVLDQLKTRKQNLEILEICESLQECVDILRGELKLLFEMEDWRKSDRQRAQETSILSLVLLLENKKRVNY